MDIKKHLAIDLLSFLKVIEPYGNHSWIYRGQADASWSLLAKAGRPEFYEPSWDQQRQDDLNRESDHVKPPRDLGRFTHWRREAVAFCDSLPENDLECLAYAQHYGLATRLLDWTSNPLVALYFAAETHEENDGAVFAYLDWFQIPLKATEIPDYHNVAAYIPRPFDRRLLMQASVFTYHPEPHLPLTANTPEAEAAKAAPDGGNLIQVIIPSRVKPIILRQLAEIGISRKMLFPDLERLSGFVNWETKRSVKFRKSEKSKATSKK